MPRRKGQTDRICGAIKPDGISLCTHPPGWGTDHKGFGRCRQHGGTSPSGNKQAAVREAKARATEFGQGGPNIDPADALRQELSRTNQMIEWARSMCQGVIEQIEKNSKLSPNQQDTSLPVNPLDVALDIRFQSYQKTLDDERDRLVRIARSSLDTNIAARKQALAEALASVVIECFHAMTRSIPDLSPAQLSAAQDALKVELGVATERLLLTAGGEGTQ